MVEFKLDTESQVNILLQDKFQTITQKKMTQQRTNITKMTKAACNIIIYSGHRIVPMGQTTIDIDGRSLRFLIVQNGSAILGKEACQALHLLSHMDYIEATPADTLSAEHVVK